MGFWRWFIQTGYRCDVIFNSVVQAFRTGFIRVLQHWYHKMLLKPLAGSGNITSKHPFLHRNIIVRNVWRIAQKSYRIEHFGRVETHVAFFCVPRFLHTSNGFSMILTHVKCDFRCHDAKSMFLQRFYKQNEITYILCIGVLWGLGGAPLQCSFFNCFKTPARINLLHGNITFCALVPAGSNLHFLSQRDLEGAQDRFFKKCEILSKTNGKSSKWWVYDLLKHQNIQNQPRIISKTDTLDFAQFDLLPRALNWPFMPVPTLPLKAQRESKFTRIRPP